MLLGSYTAVSVAISIRDSNLSLPAPLGLTVLHHKLEFEAACVLTAFWQMQSCLGLLNWFSCHNSCCILVLKLLLLPETSFQKKNLVTIAWN